MTALLRPLTWADSSGVCGVFTATIALGRPLPFRLDGVDWFASLALGWYFECGIGDSLVAVDEAGNVVGYGLVCTQPTAHRQWLRRRTLTTTARLAAMAVTGEIGAPSRRFYASRLRDALHLARRGWHGPRLGHAHVNVLSEHRSGGLARQIRDHVDDRCRRAGLDGWVGEINARAGRRSTALARVAGPVVGTAPNRTLSRLAGEPVHRLTVVRRVVDLRATAQPRRTASRVGLDAAADQAVNSRIMRATAAGSTNGPKWSRSVSR